MTTWFLVSLVILLVLTPFVFNAPEGWEDEQGFHYGRKG